MPRQTTPSRVLVIISTIVVVAALLLLSAASVAGAGATVPYTVRTGDTLWDLAGDLTPPDGDVRATVYAIEVANGLETSVIMPGQVLELPAPR